MENQDRVLPKIKAEARKGKITRIKSLLILL